MSNNDFVYTTYIKSTPEKVWSAITNPEFTRQYWGNDNVSDWKKGSDWSHVGTGDSAGTVRVTGKVLESNPPTRLVLSWFEPDNKADVSRVSFEIEAIGELVKLHVVHDQFQPGSEMPGKVTMGWSLVLSSMKSFLESGKAIDIKAVKLCKSSKAA